MDQESPQKKMINLNKMVEFVEEKLGEKGSAPDDSSQAKAGSSAAGGGPSSANVSAGDTSVGNQPPGGASGPRSATPFTTGRVLLIHGYSAQGSDFVPWRDALVAAGVDAQTIAIGNYISLNNEVTIKDLGEALDRALRLTRWSTGTSEDSWTFDAIVHSTGMLVLRQWLTSDPFDRDDPRSRVRRLKHLVGLAPATFGSPQARKGRSWIGALVKGNRHLGPDFLNAGDEVLDGLELGSRYTWDLTHRDMVCPKPLYDRSPNTPYVTIFVGNSKYEGLAALASPPGSDGTVRWAGCSLNTRKVSVDFRREPRLVDDAGKPTRYVISKWEADRLGAPVIAVDGQNHGTIVSNPDERVVDFVVRFLRVVDDAGYTAWLEEAQQFGAESLEKMNAASAKNGGGGAGWQQLVVHVVDDHGDGVSDFNMQLFIGDNLDQSDDPDFPSVEVDVDTYTTDNSYRCFYIRLSPDMLTLNANAEKPKLMWIELIASSGSTLIEYEAYTGDGVAPQRLTIDQNNRKSVKLDITNLAQGNETLLYPYTTTLLEIFVEREPMPLGEVSNLFNFLGR